MWASVGAGGYAVGKFPAIFYKSSHLVRLAEGVGFEPTVRFHAHTLSKRAPSTARPSLRRSGFIANNRAGLKRGVALFLCCVEAEQGRGFGGVELVDVA